MKVQKLPKPCTHYSWKDRRTPEEIQADIKRRAQTKEQRDLDFYLSSPENYEKRKRVIPEVKKEQLQEV